MRRRTMHGRRRRTLLIGTAVLSIAIVIGSAFFILNYSSHKPTTSITSSDVVLGTKVGNRVPDFQIQLIDGTTSTLSSYQGRPVLLWFVATWCSSCLDGAKLLSQQYYSQLHDKGVTILTVELYDNLGQSGPPIAQFASQYGGAPRAGWFYGTSDQNTTHTYDPMAYLDVYYVINSHGTIVASGVGLPNDLPKLVSTF